LPNTLRQPVVVAVEMVLVRPEFEFATLTWWTASVIATARTMDDHRSHRR
jgi:hypothetical protein